MGRLVRTFSLPFLLLFAGAGAAGCHSPSPMAREIDFASGGANWRDKGGLTCRISVTPVDQPAFAGQLVYHVSTHRFVIQRLHDGALEQVGYREGRLWTRAVPPDDLNQWMQLIVYASFVAVPFDLVDSSVTVRELQPMTLGGESFRIGLIDRPSAGGKFAIYIGHDDRIPRALTPLPPKTDTDNSDPESQAKGYAVVYEKIVTIEGIALPSRWTVRSWDSRQGVGQPVAVVELSDASFGNLQPSASPQFDWNVAGFGGRWWR